MSEFGAMAALVVNEYLDLPMGRRLSRKELVAELVDLFLRGIQRSETDAPHGSPDHGAGPRAATRLIAWMLPETVQLEKRVARMARVAFIVPRNPRKPLESSELLGQPVGWGCVSLGTILAGRGHQVEILDEGEAPIDPGRVQAEVVGISIMTANARRGYQLADAFRLAGQRVLLGGAHASALPEEALRHADAVVGGEGEGVIAEAVESVSRSAVLHGTPVDPLDDLPLPDPKLARARLQRELFAPIFTSRGCPWGCDFCSESTMFGRRYRKRSLEAVLQDLTFYGRRPVAFYDANLGVDRRWLKEFLRRIALDPARWFRWDVLTHRLPWFISLPGAARWRLARILLETPYARSGYWGQYEGWLRRLEVKGEPETSREALALAQ